jgi:hypothetical protein
VRLDRASRFTTAEMIMNESDTTGMLPEAEARKKAE